jgi:hypothetical protein
MKNNWIIAAAKKAAIGKNLVILENPDAKRTLDDLLINRFWPVIKERLRSTKYQYLPEGEPKTELNFKYALERSLTFMLLDGRKAFFRGCLNCSTEAWMIESEFFLGLAKDNDPKVIFEIIGNSRLTGNPPSLSIYKGYPDYFQITFRSGSGAEWFGSDDEKIKESLKQVIEVNTELYELSKSGYITEDEFAEFMSLAYTIYEAI